MRDLHQFFGVLGLGVPRSVKTDDEHLRLACGCYWLELVVRQTLNRLWEEPPTRLQVVLILLLVINIFVKKLSSWKMTVALTLVVPLN